MQSRIREASLGSTFSDQSYRNNASNQYEDLTRFRESETQKFWQKKKKEEKVETKAREQSQSLTKDGNFASHPVRWTRAQI